MKLREVEMRAFAILSLFAVLTTTSAALADVVYDCRFNHQSSFNVPDQVLITLDRKASVVMVMDPFIKSYVGKPIAGTIVNDSAKRLTVSWELENVKAKGIGSIRRIRSRMTIMKGTLEALYTESQGVGDSETGSGRCKVVK